MSPEDQTRALEARVTELEVRDMQKQKALDDLADALWEKEQRIAALEKRIEALVAQVTTGHNEAVPNEPPPHY